LLFNPVLAVEASTIRPNQNIFIKGIQIGKKEVKLSLFIDIIYIEDPIEATKSY
jgi:hypothetical protein